MLLQLVLLSAVLPALAAVLALIALRALAPRGGERRAPVVALALGYVVGHLGVAGAPRLLPTESTQALFYLALAGALVGILESRRPAVLLRWTARVALLGGVVWMTLRATIRYDWEWAEAGVWLA